jgi:hypothetical protein
VRLRHNTSPAISPRVADRILISRRKSAVHGSGTVSRRGCRPLRAHPHRFRGARIGAAHPSTPAPQLLAGEDQASGTATAQSPPLRGRVRDR